MRKAKVSLSVLSVDPKLIGNAGCGGGGDVKTKSQSVKPVKPRLPRK